ncbi:hypothetical protein LINGRAPRIM_LOCUS3444 [Linum grandiflorum]
MARSGSCWETSSSCLRRMPPLSNRNLTSSFRLQSFRAVFHLALT